MKNDIMSCKDYFKKYKTFPSVLKYGEKSAQDIDISVCIPTFDRPDLLEECIRSCLKQKSSRLSIELIVVDNDQKADNDNLKLIQRIGRRDVCYYQNGANLGIFGNWNRCIELARGKWVSLLHDDDLLAPDCFRLWEKLLASPKLSSRTAYIKTQTIMFHGLQEIKKNGIKNRIRKKYGTRFCFVNKFDFIIEGVPRRYGAPTCGTLLRRDAALETGGYNTECFHPTEDVFFPVRLFDRGYRVAYTVAPFGYYRYAVNMSLKNETHIGWVRDAVDYRYQIKKFGEPYKTYGRYFEDAQLYVLCQNLLKWFVKPCEQEGYFDEVAEVRRIKVKKIRFMLYKIILKVYACSFFVRALIC